MAGTKILSLPTTGTLGANDKVVIARPGSPSGTNFGVEIDDFRKNLVPSGDNGDVLTYRDDETPYSTGTIQIVPNAAGSTVTLTGGIFPAWAATGDVLVFGSLYSVLSRDSDTVLKLDDTTVTVAGGTAYTLQKRDLVAEHPRWRVLTASTDNSGDYSATTPTLSVTGATNATPIVVTCNNHRLKTGLHCRITGCTNTAANNKAVGGGPTPGTNSANPELWEVDAGTTRLVDATNAAPIVISTFPIRHQLTTGDRVRIDGVKGNEKANSGYSTGTVTVTAGVVTLSGGTWPAAAASGYLVVNGLQYVVSTRDNDTQLTLTDVSVTAAAGSIYQLWIAFAVTVTSSYVFSLTASDGTSGETYDGGGTVSFANTFKLKKIKNNTRVAITGAAAGDEGRIRLTTTFAHGFSDYDLVIVEDVAGTTEANNSTSNDTWSIDVIDATHIDLFDSTFTNAWTSGGTVELAFQNQIDDAPGNGTSGGGGTMIRPARIKIWATTLDEAEAIGFSPGLPIRMKTLENSEYAYGVVGSIPGYEGYPITRDAVTANNAAYELTFAGPPLLGNLTELAIGQPHMVHQLEFVANKHPYFGAANELPLSQLIQPGGLVDKWRMTGGGTVLGEFGEAYQRWFGGNGFLVAYQIVQREFATEGTFTQTGVGTTVTIVKDKDRPFNADGFHTDGSTMRGSKVTRSAAFANQGDGRTGLRGYIFNKTTADTAITGRIEDTSVVVDSKNGSEFLAPIIDATFEASFTLANGAATRSGTIININRASHGRKTGELVQIRGMTGITGANGIWKLTVVDANNYTLDLAVGGGAGSVGGDFSYPIMLTTSKAHGQSDGCTIVVHGVPGNTNANGTWRVDSLSDTTLALFTDTALTIASTTAAAPISCAVTAHGFSTGDIVRIFNCGNINANGAWVITSTGADSFTLDGSLGGGGSTQGGGQICTSRIGNAAHTGVRSPKTITNATYATPIVISSTAHGFSNGDLVVLSNVNGNTVANGLWMVAGAAANSFNLVDYNSNNSVGNGYYGGGGEINQYGGFIQNALLATEWILESLTMEAAAGHNYELQDEAQQPAINVDCGGQLLSPFDFYRGIRTARLDNILTFGEAAEINRESYDIVHGTRLELACTSIGNRPGIADSDDLTLGGAQFLSVFAQIVEE